MHTPTCPKCNSIYAYQDNALWICPECAHEWSPTGNVADILEGQPLSNTPVRDANGNVLQDGDTVTVIKDLKVKGSSASVKVGTKVKNIRLVESNDGHNIACKIDGFGAMKLKSEFVKRN